MCEAARVEERIGAGDDPLPLHLRAAEPLRSEPVGLAHELSAALLEIPGMNDVCSRPTRRFRR